ncbi:MAG: PAS domain-containing protein, partial [Bacillota bacterium]|nr:PAS domain-containing protein [Bacillota bacterium]
MAINRYECPIEHLYAILESTHYGIVAIDKIGTITFFNSGAQTILGINVEEAMGENIANLLNTPSLLTTVKSGKQDVGKCILLNGRT